MLNLLELQTQSAVEIVEALLEEAVRLRATDIHIDPTADLLVVRVRVDGLLKQVGHLEKIQHESVVARVKVLAEMRSDVHSLAQDGRFTAVVKNQNLDVRASVAPTFFGENVVLRLLFTNDKTLTLPELGFSKANEDLLHKGLSSQSGMVIVCGPTGSGKTTTLYSLLTQVGGSEYAVVTLEDPVEYPLPHVRHIGVNTQAGFGFAEGLRWIVRQNPDIIMLGEIRDSETAKMAVQSALTGHLLFTSIHTKDAPSAVTRLLDLGVESFLVASSVQVVCAQRLVRKLCAECKRVSASASKSLSEILSREAVAFEADGCEFCLGTGYFGRTGLHEVLVLDERLRQKIMQKSSWQDLRQQALQNGMNSLRQCGLEKVARGETSLTEILRITTDEL